MSQTGLRKRGGGNHRHSRKKHITPAAGKAALAFAAAGTLAAGAYAATAELLVRGSMDREQPELIRRQRETPGEGGSPDPLQTEAAALAEKLLRTPMETVHIDAPDGIPLAGHWLPVPGAKRVIVAMHGWRSAWYRDFAAIADFWRERGCSVLFAEQRAHGQSGGKYLGFGLLERYDCLEWVKWAEAHTDPDLPIYPAGISMGAATVLLAAGLRPLPERLRGIMADCGFTSMDAVCRHVTERDFHLPYNLLRPLTSYLCRKRIGCAPDAASTPEALRNCPVPVLLVHGLADTFVPPEMSRENAAALGDRGTLLLVPEARHGMSCLVDPEGYRAAVSAFWEKCEAGEAATPANEEDMRKTKGDALNGKAN